MANGIELLVADAVAVLGAFLAPQWGIFLDGVPVLSYDNQIGFQYTQDWKISTYPVEQGSFQTYNKVQFPSEIRCKIAAGGSTINRTLMLDTIDSVMSTTELYDVVTPEKVYLGYNFTHRDLDREAKNVGLLVVDLWLVEVIESATAQFQNTQTPDSAGQVSSGNVTVQPTDPATQSSVNASGWQ